MAFGRNDAAMNGFKPARVLVLAPHTDDGELGCGATISKFIDDRIDVFYAAFSACEQSVPKEFPKDILVTEVKSATRALGLRKQNLLLFRYEVRTFQSRRQEILDEMIRLRRDIDPDLVLLPSGEDIHQDHQVVSQEGLRAFKFASALGYEIPWNNLAFRSSMFIHLNERNLARKVTALGKYRSQAHRDYMTEDFVRSWARTRGVQIGARYAEAYEVLRWIIR